MQFEVINENKATVFYTYKEADIPPSEYLSSMQDGGYKFKVDGKVVSKKKVEELIKKKGR